MNYHTFDILITASGAPNSYQLFARSTTQGEAFNMTTIDPKTPPLAELLTKLEGQSISDEELIAAPEQVRILAVIPVSSGLNTEPEKQILRAVEAKLKPKIKVDFLEGPATPDAIRSALRNNEYHIVHYAGHGIFEDEQGVLLLDYNKDSSERMTADRFAHYFLDYPSIRLVVLNACQGATRSANQVLVGMSPQLVLRGVPAVIAMQDTIRDSDATLFATEFYTELCHERQGGQVEVAVSRARKALLQSGLQNSGFALPVLYLRTPDGRLWDAEPPDEIIAAKKEPKRKALLERWQVWVGIEKRSDFLLPAPDEMNKQIKELDKKIAEWKNITEKLGKVSVSPETSYLRGIVTNVDGEGIADVIITIDKLPADTTYTTSNGSFFIEKIPAKVGDRARIYVYKDSYQARNEYITLPGPVTIKMED